MTDQFRMLPGFDNVLTVYLGDDRLGLIVRSADMPRTVIARADYDSDPEFIQECCQWARANGGREIRE